MSLPNISFTTPNLFYQIREAHLHDRGFFAAYDNSSHLYLVFADATFYNLETFLRDFSYPRFTEHASFVTQSSSVRAVANGPVYIHDHPNPYNTSRWKGELIIYGNIETGRYDPHAGIKWHFGKAHGRTEKAHLAGKGKPSLVLPPFKHAVSSLLPLITGSCLYTSTQGGPIVQNGAVIRCHSPSVQNQLNWGSYYGKTIYGIHRTHNLLFFIVQPQYLRGGTSLLPIIEKLGADGVQDAFLGDGNTSSFLIVDGIVEAWGYKSGYKNNTIPAGLQLQLNTLEVISGSTTFTSINDPVLAQKVGSLPATLTAVDVELKWTNAGQQMTINSLGAGLTGMDLQLGTQPVVLTLQSMSSNDLVQGCVFEFANAETVFTVNCGIHVDDPSDRGSISGYFRITQGSPPDDTRICEGDFNWFLA